MLLAWVTASGSLGAREYAADPRTLKDTMKRFCRVLLASAVLAMTSFCFAQQQQMPKDDLTPGFKAPEVEKDYVKRVEMIPMRDGVKLYTVIVIPKGAHDAPMVLTRTPYNAAARAERTKDAAKMIELLPLSDEDFVKNGYIRVYQDVRGKYGSEGVYLMTPPPVDSGYNPSGADDTTDAYDTIDWLVKNVPESNGRVGMIGSSYEGFTVVMALLHPHAALKAAVPESPMIDGWMGDDWFHYGAYRQNNVDFITSESSVRGDGKPVPRDVYDDYEGYLRAGSVDGWARMHGVEQYPYYQRAVKHAAYDEFWQGQALDKLLAQHPSNVPTMWEQGLYDQEDMWGAIHSWRALKAAGHEDNNYLVIGPWRHSGANYDGTMLGQLKFEGDTGLQWRRDVL
ncbi:MAG TPA: CocE/NonD family hydrolase, partial [Ktedonobacterales bacterium]|nr:CocE/NonD family hydrolase [Ktedonobacterales bacterium]